VKTSSNPNASSAGALPPRSVARTGWYLAALSFGAVALPWLGIAAAAIFLPPHVDLLRQLGWILWLPYVILAGIAVGFALAPTHLTSLLAGYLLGFAAGLPASLAAIGIGTIIGFSFARRLAKDRLRELIDRSSHGRILAARLLDAQGFRTAAAVALARLPPQVPFAVGNLLAASARVPVPSLVAGTLAGMLPRAAMAVWVGAELVAWSPGQKLPSGLLWSLAAAVVGFGGLAIWSAIVLRSSRTNPDPTRTHPPGD